MLPGARVKPREHVKWMELPPVTDTVMPMARVTKMMP